MTWRDKYRRDPDLAESIIITLQNDLSEALNERDQALAEVELLRGGTRPEPSRLEIAARIVQGWASCSHPISTSVAFRTADALLAAAKKAQP